MKAIKLLNLAIALVLVLALLPAPNPAIAQDSNPPEDTPALHLAPGDPQFIPGEMIVMLEEGLTSDDLNAKAGALAGEVGAQVVEVAENAALFSFDAEADVLAFVDTVKGQEGVVGAQPNYVYSVPEIDPVPAEKREVIDMKLDNDIGAEISISKEELLEMRTRKTVGTKVTSVPTFPEDLFNNWGNDMVDLELVWSNVNASPTTCVIDTGVDGAHPDLFGKVINGYDYVNDDPVPNDDYGHGTHVAGTIAARTDKDGMSNMGVSNGKILAVKALNFKGSGSSWDIGMAIVYCANSTAKVINMSLGGGALDPWEYYTLSYAINSKKKLVVASAGNYSESWWSFPAAWAHYDTPGMSPNGNIVGNTIYYGVISVGAAQYYDTETWVDTNHNNVHETGEDYYNCATNFSNYGNWVSIVAPGESIFSTLPVSYPFTLYWSYGFSPGWDYMNGTSMAAPHVAGAAARVWSINPTKTNDWIKQTLIDTGEPISLADDPSARDRMEGYDAGSYYGDAPFCWPYANGAPYTSYEDMSQATYLNVAKAMHRGALVMYIVDAGTGLPLTGATVRAVTTSGLVKDTSIVASLGSAYVLMINLPDSYYYNMQVNKSGYTRGYQTVSRNMFTDSGGIYFFPTSSFIGVPPDTQFRAVLNWYGTADLDLHAIVPYDSDDADSYRDVVYYGNPGEMLVPPYARHQNDSMSSAYIKTEEITIKARGSYPYFPGFYDFLITSFGGTGSTLNNAYPAVRVWYKGYLKQVWQKTTSCATDQNWWWAGYFRKSGTGTSYGYMNQCNTLSNMPFNWW